MDVRNYEIKDEQARFLIMRNFYQEVMSKLLKRFLMVLHFRATGDKLGENCDIMSKILPHLPKKHILKKEDKYRANLFLESKRDLTPKPNLDVSTFDFSMSFACLTEIQGLPSWKNHQFCILCTSNCKNILLGNAEKKECNNCAFCTTSPIGSCYSNMLTTNLNIGRKTRNIGAHTSQFSAEIPNIQENISAITDLYEYLHTNGNWTKFKEDWINEEEYNKIKEDIKLIEKCSISFLLEKFKERIRILEEVFVIKEMLDNIMSEIKKKSTLEISIQLSISALAVKTIVGLESFLEEAELDALNSEMRMIIEKVVNKSLTHLSDEFKFDVRVWELEKVPGNGRFEKFKAGIEFSSPNPNAFKLYQSDRSRESKVLQTKLTESFFEELEKKVINISDVSLTNLKLGFTSWKIGSLHIMLALGKNNRSSFNKNEIEILNTSIKNMTISQQSFFKELFGESVEVSIDTSPSGTNIATFGGQLEVNILSENVYYHSDEFANKLKRSVKMLLAQELKLEECSEINKNLATMLYSAEQSVSLHSQTSLNLVNIAKIGSVHEFIVETLPWFVLTIDVEQVNDVANPKTGYKDPMKSEIEETKKSENTKESYEMTNLTESKLKTDWRILWGSLLTEVKNNLRSLFHHPASGNFPKDGGKLYKAILELYQNGELDDLPKYWQRLILPKNGISDSEIFDLYTLRCLLSKSKSMKAHTVYVIEDLCSTMYGIKYYPNVDPYFMSVYIIDKIKDFLSTLGFVKESLKEVERLSALLEDVTLSEDELLEDKCRRRYFEIEEDIDEYVHLAELLFKAEEYLRCLFHDPEYGNFPRNGRKLYEAFIEWNKQGKLNDLEKKYFSTLLPDSKITDSETFDLHLLCYFLCKCTNIKDEERKIFDEIFDLTNQFIRCESIGFDFYQRMDILYGIVWKIKPLSGHYDLFNRYIISDLYKFSYRRKKYARRRLKKKNIVRSKMGYKMDRTDEKKTFEQTEILPK